MTVEELLAMPSVCTDYDVAYLPKPNSVDVVLSDELAPAHLTRTAFVIAVLGDGSLVLTTNRRRGIEIPGGHIEPGEDTFAAARREVLEEAGCVVDELVPIGFLRMHSKGSVPEGWAYPHPLGYQQFFAARVLEILPYVENDECLTPTVLRADEVLHRLKVSQLSFYKCAQLLLEDRFRPVVQANCV